MARLDIRLPYVLGYVLEENAPSLLAVWSCNNSRGRHREDGARMQDCTTPPQAQASVYRYYDRDGTLLYVGVTKRGQIRNCEHASFKEWWPYVSTQEVEHFPTYQMALSEEKALICERRPPFNKQHNPDHASMSDVYVRVTSNVGRRSFESLCDLYSALDCQLPMQIVQESGGNNTITLKTYPEHYPLARAIELKHAVQIKDAASGKYLGKITRKADQGLSTFLRGKLKDAGEVHYPYGVAKIRVTNNAKHPSVRLSYIEIVPCFLGIGDWSPADEFLENERLTIRDEQPLFNVQGNGR